MSYVEAATTIIALISYTPKKLYPVLTLRWRMALVTAYCNVGTISTGFVKSVDAQSQPCFSRFSPRIQRLCHQPDYCYHIGDGEGSYPNTCGPNLAR